MPDRLKSCIKLFAYALIVFLPFDNALYHFASFSLLLVVVASFRWTGMEQFKAAVAENKLIHSAFGAIWLTMLITNSVNAQSAEAWRTMAQFGPRYWLLFALFSYLLFAKIISVRAIFIAAVGGLSLQFIPFIPTMLDLSIFDTRFHGMNRNPNIAGFQSGALALLSLYLIFQSKNNGRFVYPLFLFLGGIALIALLASGNRGSWVALVATSVLFLATMFPKNPNKASFIFVGCAATGAFILTQFSGPANRLQLLLQGYSTHRFDVWSNALDLFLQKPMLGHGLDTRAIMSANHWVYHEHNIFLSVLTAMGVVGLLAYLLLMMGILKAGLKNKNYLALLFVAFVLIRGMFGFDFYRKQIFVATFVLASAVAVCRRGTDNETG